MKIFEVESGPSISQADKWSYPILLELRQSKKNGITIPDPRLEMMRGTIILCDLVLADVQNVNWLKDRLNKCKLMIGMI